MTKVPALVVLAASIGLVPASGARAQTTIDVAKITCDQFRMYRVGNPNYIAIWIDGYYSSKRDSTLVDVESFKDKFNKLNDYCITHLDVPVMQAAKTLFDK